MFKFLLVLLTGSALTAGAATITVQPASQTISLGSTTSVDVSVGGLTARQAVGAFDLLVNSNSSIIRPTSVTFYSALGNPADELDIAVLTASAANAAESSFETTATLLALQSNQPFSLFSITYKAVGVGTSALTLGLVPPDYLVDGSGKIIANPTLTNGSITVMGNVATTPEPSTLVLLVTGLGAIGTTIKRRGLRRQS